MLKNFCQCQKPSASKQGDMIVLSFPDAIDPSVVMLGAEDIRSLSLKIVETADKTYAIQKISADSKGSVDNIAVYADKKQAVKALRSMASTLKAGSAGGFVASVLRLIGMLIAVGVVLYGVLIILPAVLNLFTSSQPQPGMAFEGMDATPQSFVTDNPEALGVPMSADAFLENSKTNRLPF